MGRGGRGVLTTPVQRSLGVADEPKAGRSSRGWENVSRRELCPVCGHDSWCSLAADRKTVVCRRIESDRAYVDSGGTPYWVHHLEPLDVPAFRVAYDSDPVLVPLADVVNRDRVYRRVLELLTLEDRHREALKSRGFTDDQIDRNGYRSLPRSGREGLAEKLRASFVDEPDVLVGIPGLHHRNSDSRWTFGGWEGLLIPVRDEQARIVALKTRDDDPGSDQKYRYVSSRSYGGASPGNPVHVPLHGQHGAEKLSVLDIVRITEGELKADLATASTRTLTLSVPGVSTWQSALEVIREMGVNGILLAFDADATTNPYVQRALVQAVRTLLARGYDTWVETWPVADGKGIDDLLAAGKKTQRHAGTNWLSVFGQAPELPGPIMEEERERPETPILLEPGLYDLTDDGNARRLIAIFGNDVRYHTASDEWLVWDDHRFRPDRSYEITRRARVVARAISYEAERATDPALARDTLRWGLTSQSQGKLTAMVSLARSDAGVAVGPEDLDTNPWLFNAANGTIDLRTGELLEPDRANLITRISPVEYDPDAELGMWDDFLGLAFGGNSEITAFAQRLLGYSLYGLTPEEILPMILGPAGSGKSTLISTLLAVFGDYARTAEFDTFLQRSTVGNARNDVARLVGARFVAATEVDRGRKLSQQVIKSLTGSDEVTARFLYKEAFTFRPGFLLALVANDAPAIEHDDDGMWRRVLKLSMDHPIPSHRRDPRVKETLRDPSRGGPAVLAWLVKGCLAWQKDGLQIPECVHDDTAAYRAEQDPLDGYIGLAVHADAAAWTSNEDLWLAYQWWAETTGEPKPITQKALSFQFSRSRLGLQSKPVRREGKTVRGWIGLGLTPEAREGIRAVTNAAGTPEAFDLG